MDVPPSPPRPAPLDGEDPLSVVRRVAALARLDVDEGEARALAPQFARILDCFRGLATLDVEGVEPLTRPGSLVDVKRPDDPLPSLPRDALLELAPDARDGFFAVPKTIGEAP